jgi:HEAT repeat protein
VEEIATLARGLKEATPTRRLAILGVLGDRANKLRGQLSIGDPRRSDFPPPILQAIRDTGPQVAELVQDENAAVRHGAVQALGRIRASGEVVSAALKPALTSNDRLLRATALGALEEYLDRQAEINDSLATINRNDRLPAVERLLTDWTVLLRTLPGVLDERHPDVVRGILKAYRGGVLALAKAQGLTIGEVQAKQTADLRRQVEEWVAATQVWLPLLTKDFDKHDAVGQALTAALTEDLARLCDPRVEATSLAADRDLPPELRRPLHEQEPQGRLLRSDLQPEGKRAAEALLSSLANAASELTLALPTAANPVQRAVLEAFEAMGPAAKGAAPAVVARLEDESKFVRWSATRALGRIGPTAAAPLVVQGLARRLQDDDIDVRLAACQALGSLKSHAAPALAALGALVATAEPDVQLGGVQALELIVRDAEGAGEGAVAGLATALTSRDYRVRQVAARILGLIGPKARAALPALQHALADREVDVRLAAAEAMVKITTP